MDVVSSLLRTARQQTDALAVADLEMELRWGEYAARIGRLAGALRALGVRNGQPVGVLSLSSVRVFETFYAVPWAGGVVCPLNSRLSVVELAAIMEEAEIEILFVDAEFLPQGRTLQQRLPRLRQLIYAGAGHPPAGTISYEALLMESSPLLVSECRPEDVACLYYTGGTTGKPKGVMLTHRNVCANTLNFALASAATEEDRFLSNGPLFHVAAGSRIYNAGALGAAMFIMPRFEAQGVLDNIERHGITLISLVPTMMNTLINLPDLRRHDLSSLRMILYGAAQISPTLLEKVIREFHHVELCQAYGQTETAPFATVLAPRYHALDGPLAGKLHSVGKPIGNVEVRVVDAADADLPAGAVGEVLIRGDNVMKGYFKQPELTAQALRGGWMHSGDLGYFDADGFLFIVDRIKDMIISGGENIYSSEVENAIASHPDVIECAVFGIPDEVWGELVHAVIVPRPHATLDPAAVVTHCRQFVGGFKVPRSIQIRREPLPLSSANKILKTQLREEYLRAAQARSV